MKMRRYEVNYEQWEKIYCRLKKRDDPLKISAIPLWVMSTGTSWRDIPERYGKWNTIYKCFAHWSNLGIFEKLSKENDFTELSVDSTYVKAASGAKKGLLMQSA